MSNLTRSSLLLYDDNGNEHRAIITQHWAEVTNMQSTARERIPTLADIRLEDGEPLKFVDENTFKTMADGLLYRKPPTKK